MDERQEVEQTHFSWRWLLGLVTACGLMFGFLAWLQLPMEATVSLVLLVVLPIGLMLWYRRYAAASLYGLFWLALILLLPMVSWSHESARRVQCSNNLKQLTLALHAYHDVHGSFPPAYVADAEGRPMHSWRVLILPFIERKDMYDVYRFDEPWDGPNNSKLAKIAVDLFQCPSEAPSYNTNYVAIVGPGTAWPGATSMKLGDITDGWTDTLLLVEVAESGIHWLEPRDLHVGQMAPTINAKKGQGISSPHSGGANVSMADGSVRFLSDETRPDLLRKLLSPYGGEEIVEEY